MASYVINKRLLKREPSLTETGQIACSLPPGLERGREWPKSSNEEETSPPVQTKAIMLDLSVERERNEARAPAEFDEAQWKAAAEANPKLPSLLETKHGYHASTSKNHSSGSMRQLMQLIAPHQSSHRMSMQLLPDVPEFQELFEDSTNKKEAVFLATNLPPNLSGRVAVSEEMDHKVYTGGAREKPVDALTEPDAAAHDKKKDEECKAHTAFGKTNTFTSLID